MDAPDLSNTTDAQEWAQEFMHLHEDHLEDIDEGLMIAWFANALGVGREAGRSTAEKNFRLGIMTPMAY